MGAETWLSAPCFVPVRSYAAGDLCVSRADAAGEVAAGLLR